MRCCRCGKLLCAHEIKLVGMLDVFSGAGDCEACLAVFFKSDEFKAFAETPLGRASLVHASKFLRRVR